jgi:arginine/lysine/ornithine decarboxylase
MKSDRTPIVDALVGYTEKGIRPFHMPAHKGRLVLPGMEKFLTMQGMSCDLPCMEETDSWNHPTGCIAQAKRNASELYNTADTFFLVNGSSMGNQVMLLSLQLQGKKLLLPRNFHISAFAAMALAGITPQYLPVSWADGMGSIPPTTAEIIQHINEETGAVFITNPTYYGIGANLTELAAYCRQKQIPLIVDEAHGAHLAFSPAGFAQPALAAGTDLVVQSLHKTLGSMIGTAQIHVNHSSLIAPDQVQYCLNLLQSTSSSNILLSSIDLCQAWLATDGRAAIAETIEQISLLRQRLQTLEHIRVMDTADPLFPTHCAIDPFKLVMNVSALGLTGFAAESILKEEEGILCEFSDLSSVVFAMSPHDHHTDYQRLFNALWQLDQAGPRNNEATHALTGLQQFAIPEMKRTPREACMARKTMMPLQDAVGTICGELISVYPPGIPLICPGEVITAAFLETMQTLLREKACIYSTDHSHQHILVIQP